MPPVPAGFVNAGMTITQSGSTLDSSDHVNKTNYYTPANDFSQLIGCPLNGEWSINVCDLWGADNGWVFGFSVDICGISTSGCQYQVAIDSLVWTPDTAAQYHDYTWSGYKSDLMRVKIDRCDDINVASARY